MSAESLSTDQMALTPQAVAADIAKEFREDHTRWTQRWYARLSANPLGGSCGPHHEKAVCWCLRGAIDKRFPTDVDVETLWPIYEAFDKALDRTLENRLHFVDWNDDPKRTIGEVIALCEKVAAS